ncbi:hypothetical protein [Clostridium sp. KNHs205]|uniref:hypothetical protein n=1 Tax=Clostridium sp. KNHs205 TaxID=1449050 RepID=UPI00051B9907|nr:hypothetical protein [Clostridium sp. KNHs205]
MTDVKGIFHNTFTLYKAYLNEELFQNIVKYIFAVDSNLVPRILTDTYSFYLKWKGTGFSEQMVAEARELSRKHGDNDLVRHITVDLCTIIEQGGKH